MKIPANGKSLPPGMTFAPLAPNTPSIIEAARLYCAEWPGYSDNEIVEFFTERSELPGYHGLVALLAQLNGAGRPFGPVAAFGFGHRSLPRHSWHKLVAAQIGADHPALQDAWLLAEMAVAPADRGQGIGSALLETLLAQQPCPRALLSTQVDNATARRLYERHGWTYLSEGIVFGETATRFVIMCRERAR